MPNSKQKGHRGELELVHILCDRFGEGRFKRTPSSGAHTGGKNRELSKNLPWEAKITLASDIITPANFNFVIEHKFYADISFWELFSEKSNWNQWIDQVSADAQFVEKEPLLVIKYNRHERIALLPQRCISNVVHLNRFIWNNFSVVELSQILELPNDFWFSE